MSYIHGKLRFLWFQLFNILNILRYNKHSMYNQCLYQTTFCWHNADMHDSTDIHRNNTVGMQYNTNIRKKNTN